MRRSTVIGGMYLLGLLVLMGNCSEGLGPNACDEPGANEKCSCEDGRGSLRTCNAFGEWGQCYCDTPICGDGDLDQGEECDDGNNADGDGCSADCASEGGVGPGGFGGTGPTSSTSTLATSSTGMGGMAGVGGMGASGGAGGSGGLGGAGGN